MVARNPAIRAWWAGVVAVALGAALLLVAPPPAQADITRSDFPTIAQAKASLKGKGTWRRGLGDPNFVALGASPTSCRSDLPFAAAREFRHAGYFGAVTGTRKYHGQAEVTLYRFASRKAAVAAMTALATFVADCPESVEWVCEECDGIWTHYRTPADRRKVGAPSLAWKQRSIGMGYGNARVIAARTGRQIVVVAASHQTSPEVVTRPPAPRWSQVVSLTRKALARAER